MNENAKSQRLMRYGIALLVPVLVLAGLSILALSNDRVLVQWAETQHQREMLAEVQERFERELAATGRRVFDSLQLQAELVADQELLFAQLDAAQDRSEAVRGFFCLDEHHRLLFPKPRWPYTPKADVPGVSRPSRQSPGQRKRQASRKRAEQELAAALKLPAGAALIRRLRVLLASRAVGSEAWGIVAFALAECLLQGDNEAEAIALFDEIRTAASPMAGSDGRQLRLDAAGIVAILRSESKEDEGAFSSDARLIKELMEGRHDEANADQFWRAFKGALARASTTAKRLGEDRLARFTALLARASLFEQDLRWQEQLRSELAPYLARLSPDPSPSGSFIRRIAGGGGGQFLLWYRTLTTDGGRSHIFVGFQARTDHLISSRVEPFFGTLALERGFGAALVGSDDRVLASSAGWEQSAGKPGNPGSTQGSSPESAPFWRIVVRRSPEVVSRQTWSRMMLSLGLIVAALTSVGFGAYTTFHFVRESLELARLKADFVSNITHELKTPLTSIQMFTELLILGRVRDDEKRNEYYGHIAREAQNLWALMDEVLDFARSEAVEVRYVLSPGDLSEVLDAALELYGHSAELQGASIDCQYPPVGTLPSLNMDAGAITRVVVNLLSNAVKYSPEQAEVILRAEAKTEELVISVQDHGVGIDPENRKRIFDKFFREGDPLTREVSGTGLGLALCESIVRSHGGRIEVESEKGKGSTFKVFLPVASTVSGSCEP